MRVAHLTGQRRVHVFKVGGSNFLLWGITASLQKKIERYTQFGAVCYHLPTKKLRKKLGPVQIWGVRTPFTPSGCAHCMGPAPPRHGIWHGASRKLNAARTVEKRAALM